MTPNTDRDDDLPNIDAGDLALLRNAAHDLRSHTDARWVEVSGRILVKALQATRRSHPVRAESITGPVNVNEQVIIAYLREAIEKYVTGGVMTGVSLHTGPDHEFRRLTIEMVAEYGTPLMPVADRTRDIAAGVLSDILGLATPSVVVSTMHVHFSDVTVQDHPGPPRVRPGTT